MEAFTSEESWDLIRQLLPSDLDAIARRSGSFRRARMVEDGQSLLRLLLLQGSGLCQRALREKGGGSRSLQKAAWFYNRALSL